MSGFRNKVEGKFADLANWSYRHKYIAIAIPLVITAFMLLQFKNLRLESSLESFFHDDDPAKIAYDEFQDVFGKDDFFIIALQPQNVFDRDFLKDLKKIHRSLAKEVPYLDDVTSLVNVRETIGEEDRLIVEDLMKRVPKNGAPMAAFKKKVLSNRLYVNSLISADGKLTAIAVRPDTYRPGRKEPLATAEYTEMYVKIKEIVEPYRAKGIEIHYAGNPVFSSVIESSMIEDVGRMTSLSLALIALILTIMFRKFSGTIYPFCIVVVSVVATLGTMALLDLPISMVTLIVPAFLVVVGVADSVHILAIF
ncbi:MAG: MMPL family transporter [Deltaproteobacteria bacterium]|nr:MMPL family transporter [Deltaproteobacteria bacterium]